MSTMFPDGRSMLRLEASNAMVPMERKPTWMKNAVHTGPPYRAIRSRMRAETLHTLRQEAGADGQASAHMRPRYVTVTGVTRDDLDDEGA